MRYLASITKQDLLIYDPLDQYKGFPDHQRYVPKNDGDAGEFNAVCAEIKSRGNMTLYVEECERYIGQSTRLGDDAFDIINRGRNWGIGIVGNTRRIQNMSKDFFDLCQWIFFFKSGLRSRDYIERMIGRPAALRILLLKEQHFLAYNLRDESYVEMHLDLTAEEAAGEGPIRQTGKVETGEKGSLTDEVDVPDLAEKPAETDEKV